MSIVTLTEFVGNGELIGSLKNLIDEHRLPHALILSGPVGSGRRTLAMAIARQLACLDESAPCGRCAACRCTDNPDITVVTPEKNEITVAQVREIRALAFVVPNQSAARVFIIPDAQLMNETAQNALLKVLEEPPEQVYFILTAEYPHQLIDTVLSRSVAFRLSLPSAEEGCDYICAEYPQYTRAEALNAMEQCGTIGAALELLGGGNQLREMAENILSLVDADSELELLKALLPFAGNRKRAQQVIEHMADMLREALAVKSGAHRDFHGQQPDCMRFGGERLFRLIGACETAISQCESNIGEGLLATHFCADLRRAVGL